MYLIFITISIKAQGYGHLDNMTTELSKLLTSCLNTIKKHVIKYCEKVYNFFLAIKN